MSVTVEQITAVGQSILDEIKAMPAEQRLFNPLADFLAARFRAMPESEIKEVLLDVLPQYVEQNGLIAAEDEDKPRNLPFGWDLEIPQLKLRRDIWENLPVVVEALGTGADGAERHAIRVHFKNWAEWRETKAVDFDDWQNWDINTEFRLMKALESCRAWTVEESDDPNTFAVIRMNFVAPAAPAAAAPAAPAPAALPAAPVLTRINDITSNFPTCWNNETTPRSSARRGDIISISIHNMKLRNAGMDRATVERDLMAALCASPAWRVLAPAAGSREFCRLHMA